MKILAIITTSSNSSRRLLLCNVDYSEVIELDTTDIPLIDLVVLGRRVYGLDEDGNIWEIFSHAQKVNFIHQTRLSPDSLNGTPSWLATQGNVLLAGGDGQRNQSIYVIKISERKKRVRVDRVDLTRGYDDLRKEVISKTSVKDVTFISAAITDDSTYYLATDENKHHRYLLCKENSRTTCRLIETDPGVLEIILNHGPLVIGFFHIPNGLVYGKLTSKGLVTKHPPKIYFGSVLSSSSSSSSSEEEDDLKSQLVGKSLSEIEHTKPPDLPELVCSIILDQAEPKFIDV